MAVPDKAPHAIPENAFTFLGKQEYFADLLKRLPEIRRGDRVLLATHDLNVRPPMIRQLLEALQRAAERGAEVSLYLDERTFPVMQRVPLAPATEKFIKQTRAALAGLEAAGVHCRVLNSTYRRALNPFAGRTHFKVAIINDDVYVGGCNLSSPAFIDMMVRWRDPATADWLYAIMHRITGAKSARQALRNEDQIFLVDDTTSLLLDAGKPGQSTIYDTALRMIDKAQAWIVMTCQYAPDTPTMQHLAAAYRRGVQVSLYFNHASQHAPGHNILHHLVFMYQRARNPSPLFERRLDRTLPFLHAKLLVTEQEAMIGSHNYVAAGVRFGTAELTLHRRSPTFAKQLLAHFEQELQAAARRSTMAI